MNFYLNSHRRRAPPHRSNPISFNAARKAPPDAPVSLPLPSLLEIPLIFRGALYIISQSG